MALSQQATLAELTSELLTLIGQGGLGVANAQLSSRAEAAIRRAQQIVNIEAAWTINRKRAAIALLAGETEYEWPDDTQPGDILRVSAVRDANDKYEWDLEAGISSADRTSWNYGGFSTLQDVPFKYDFHDGVIEVGPASAGDVTIYMLYTLGANRMVDPSDRPSCDAEAVLRKAECVLRNDLGGEYREAVAQCEREYERYLGLIKPKQGNGATMVPGAEWAFEDMSRRSRLTEQRHWAFRTRRP